MNQHDLTPATTDNNIMAFAQREAHRMAVDGPPCPQLASARSLRRLPRLCQQADQPLPPTRHRRVR